MAAKVNTAGPRDSDQLPIDPPAVGWIASTDWVDVPEGRSYRWTASYDGSTVFVACRRMGVSDYERLQALSPRDIQVLVRLFVEAGFCPPNASS